MDDHMAEIEHRGVNAGATTSGADEFREVEARFAPTSKRETAADVATRIAQERAKAEAEREERLRVKLAALEARGNDEADGANYTPLTPEEMARIAKEEVETVEQWMRLGGPAGTRNMSNGSISTAAEVTTPPTSTALRPDTEKPTNVQQDRNVIRTIIEALKKFFRKKEAIPA